MTLQTILVSLDFSDVSPAVAEAALQMAQNFAARVVLLHISSPEPDFVGFEAGPMAVRQTTAQEIRAEHRELEEYKGRFAAAGLNVVALHIQGSYAEKVLEEAQTHGAGLIVLGSHGHGVLYNLLVGSVTADVVKGAKCPVLIVPAAKGDE
jgi:nucleotide-binding universal stress UspA family protein